VVLPLDYTFTAADNGVHTLTSGVTLVTQGSQTITATDTSSSSITGSASVTVNPAASVRLLVAGFPSPVNPGTYGLFTVTAVDSSGNIIPTFVGLITITSSDPAAALPPQAPIVNGWGTFYATLYTPGVQSLMAVDDWDTSITGAQTGIVVNGPSQPAVAGHSPSSGAATGASTGVSSGPAAPVTQDLTFFLRADHSLWQTTPGGSSVLLSPAGTIQSFTSVADRAGFDVVYAITADNHLWEHSDADPGGWQMLSAGTFASVSAASNQSGDAVAFGVLADHSLWEYSSLNPGGWAMLSPGGTILSASGVTDTSQGFAQDVVYAITADSHLWRHAPAGWSLVSTDTFQQISAGANGGGAAVVYAVGTDNSLTEFNPAFGGGSQLLSGSGTILSVTAGTRDQVFAITSDHHLWEHDAAGWALLSVGTFESVSGYKTNTGSGAVLGVLSDGNLWDYNPSSAGGWQQLTETADVLFASAPQRD
jgi:hypothetical protein